MAQVLGAADGNNALSLTVPITVAQPSGSSVHVIHAACLHGLPFFDHPSVAALPSDSKGGSWVDQDFAVSTPKQAIIGSVGDNGPSGATSGNRAGVQLGQTAKRESGADLAPGDTVTVSWTENGWGASHLTIIAAVIAFSADELGDGVTQYLGGITPGDFVGYYLANGNTGSLMPSFDGHLLDWGDAGLDLPYPHDDAAMLTGAATFPASIGGTYIPAEGTLILKRDSVDGQISLAVALAKVTAFTPHEPGGAFTGGAVGIMVGNYQFGVAAPARVVKLHLEKIVYTVGS